MDSCLSCVKLFPKFFHIEFMNYRLDGNTFENNLIAMLNSHMVDQNILFKISELPNVK